MKVALSVESLDPRRGGAETYMHWLAGRLAQDGHEVHVFALDLPNPLPAGVTGQVLHPRGPGAALRARDLCRRADAVLRDGAFDVVHATNRTLTMNVYQPHGGTTRGSMEANLALLSPARRRLQRLRWALSPRRRTFLAIERALFDRADRIEIIAVSEMVRRDMARYYGVPPGRVTVVHNGVDVARFTPAACAERRETARARHGFDGADVVALLIAHNLRLKGLGELIAALAVVRADGAPLKLLVVGRGRSAPFRRRARELGCDDAVRFAGPTDDVRDAYAAADLYCQPTHYDPCSLTVLEALACGLPVITTRMNGASELMTHGTDGLILDRPTDAAGLANALADLCDPARRLALAPAARRLAEEHSTERNYRDIMTLYQRAAARV